MDRRFNVGDTVYVEQSDCRGETGWFKGKVARVIKDGYIVEVGKQELWYPERFVFNEAD